MTVLSEERNDGKRRNIFNFSFLWSFALFHSCNKEKYNEELYISASFTIWIENTTMLSIKVLWKSRKISIQQIPLWIWWWSDDCNYCRKVDNSHLSLFLFLIEKNDDIMDTPSPHEKKKKKILWQRNSLPTILDMTVFHHNYL